MRQIPKKNYFYLLLLTVITVIVTLSFFNIYHNYSNKKESYLSKNLTNINSLDLNSLLVENSILFVYVDDIYDSKDNNDQKEIYKELKEKDLNKYFVFYDNNNKDNQKYISKNYNIDIKGKRLILVFEEKDLVIHHILDNDIENDIMNIVSSVVEDND